MNFSSENDSLCQKAIQILNPTYKALMIAEIVVAYLALLPNILLLLAVRSVTIFPLNLRFLMGHISFVLLLFSMGTIIKNTYLITTTPCAFEISILGCRIFDLLSTHFVLVVIYYNMLAVCIERIYASLNYRKYDQNQKSRLAVILIICSWTAAICVNGWNIFFIPTKQFVPFCDSTFTPAMPSQYLLPLYTSFELFGILITLSIYFYNRYLLKNTTLNRAQYDLSSRFLIDQNCQVNSILLPSMALHFLCHLPAYALLFPVKFGALPLATNTSITRLTFLVRLLYALFDPMIGFGFNVHLRKHLLAGPIGKMLKKLGINCRKPNKVTPSLNHEGEAYFDHLDKMWATVSKTIKT